jgi:co-chaperonin GroES (HSP10)
MKYTPLNDYVIVEKIESTNTTASGIILQFSNGADKARVIAIPESKTSILDSFGVPESEFSLKVGDILMIRWTDTLKIDGNTYAVDFKNIVTKLD